MGQRGRQRGITSAAERPALTRRVPSAGLATLNLGQLCNVSLLTSRAVDVGACLLVQWDLDWPVWDGRTGVETPLLL